MPILLSDSQAAAGEQLRWLVASMRRRGLTVSASNVGWGRNASDVLVGVQLASLKPFLGPVDQLRHRGCSARPTGRDAAAAVSRSLPALMWPRCAFRFETEGVGFEQLRAALSVAIVLVGSRIPVPAACALLGSITHERAVSRVLQRLHARTDWEQCTASLLALRDSLQATAPHRLHAPTGTRLWRPAADGTVAFHLSWSRHPRRPIHAGALAPLLALRTPHRITGYHPCTGTRGPVVSGATRRPSADHVTGTHGCARRRRPRLPGASGRR